MLSPPEEITSVMMSLWGVWYTICKQGDSHFVFVGETVNAEPSFLEIMQIVIDYLL